LADLVCVDPAQVKRIWPHASHLIRAAILRTGLSDFSIVQDSILNGDALLWLVWDGNQIKAAASTILEIANGEKTCVIVACGGGDMREWFGLIEQIETYAKNEKCRCTRIVGRKGWSRVLEGYSERHVILEKAL